MGYTEVLSYVPLEKVDPKYLQDETVTYVVQVNGKLRGRFDLPLDSSQEEIASLAKEQQNVAKRLDGKEVKNVVFVPNKLINFVVR